MSRQPMYARYVAIAAFAFMPMLLPVGLSYGSSLSGRVEELADRLAFSSEGEILGIEGKTVYLSLGQKDGIFEGNRFEVARLGDPLLAGDKILGYKETIIGEVEILRVRKELSIASVVKEISPVQKGDKVYQLRRKLRRVAVAEFPYENGFNALTKNIQDMLYTRLIQRGMTVVERQRLERILLEQRVASSGIVDLSTAKELGKILGVEGMVLGNVADIGNALVIRARVVDVERGVAITSAEVALEKTQALGGLLEKAIRSSELGISKAGAPNVPSVRQIVGYGVDYTDGTIGNWDSQYPVPSFNDAVGRSGVPNARWKGSYTISEDKLCLRVDELEAPSPPSHTLGVGYTVTLANAVFEDGSLTRSLVLYRFTRSPVERHIVKCYRIKLR